MAWEGVGMTGTGGYDGGVSAGMNRTGEIPA